MERRTKPSDSPFVDLFWSVKTTTDGKYFAAPDSHWDLIVVTYKQRTTVTLFGQSIAAVEVPYKANTDSFGISFKADSILAGFSGKVLAKRGFELELSGTGEMWLGDTWYDIPSFETAEAFIELLTSQGKLTSNEIVASTMKGQKRAMSERTMQRHFVQATGLSPYTFVQIQRVQEAVILLQQGISPAVVASTTGYTDQAHMARALKSMLGRTPLEIAHRPD